MKSSIKCSCGRLILAKDVMQTGHYLRLFGPSFVYVKYRCSRCKRISEAFVKQKDWERGVLSEMPKEITVEEKTAFDNMGQIRINECIDAHFEMEKKNPLKQLSKLVDKETSIDN